MVNVGERSVAWCGGVHVRFLGLGHTFMVLVESAFTIKDGHSNSSSNSSVSDMMVVLVALATV